MRKMITMTAVLLALSSPVFAKGLKISGTTGTATYGQTNTQGVQSGFSHNGFGLGAAGSITTAGASAGVSGVGKVNAKGKVTGAAIGTLSAGSTSVSSAGSLVVGNGYAANGTSGSSGSSAALTAKIK